MEFDTKITIRHSEHQWISLTIEEAEEIYKYIGEVLGKEKKVKPINRQVDEFDRH